MREMKFYHRNNSFISKYKIWRESDTVYVENGFYGDIGVELVDLPNKFFLNSGNIPKTIEAINHVFKAPIGRGEYKHVVECGEDIVAGMLTERSIDMLNIYTKRGEIESDFIEFHFDRGEIPGDPEKRLPTPAMVWVMDTLKEEYEAWKKEQT